MKQMYNQIHSIFSIKNIWKVLLFTLLNLAYTQNVDAQLEKIGSFHDTIVAVSKYNNSLYAAMHEKGNSNTLLDTIKIVKWDGASWSNITTLPYRKNCVYCYPIANMHIMNGDVYLVGEFDSFPGKHGKANVVKYNGTAWEFLTPPYFVYQYPLHSVVWDSKLWLHTQAYSKDYLNVAFYDGIKWELADSIAADITQVLYSTLDTFRNKVQLSAFINNTNGSPPLQWDGFRWNKNSDLEMQKTKISHRWLDYTHINHKGGFVRFKKNRESIDSVEFYDGQNLSFLNKGYVDKQWDLAITRDMVSYDNNLYRIGTFSKNSTTYSILIWNDTEWVPFVTGLPAINILGVSHAIVVDNKLYFITRSKDSSHVLSLETITKISGRIFIDYNGNCLEDNNEKGQENAFIELTPGPVLVNTDSSGNYILFVGKGNYALKVMPRKYWKQTCPGNDSAIYVNATVDSNFSGNDFALQSKYKVQDIRLTLSGSLGWRARKGFTETYTLCYENIGTTTASGKIALLLDSNFSNFSSSPTALNYVNPVADWKFDSLEIGEKRCITFKARIDSASINDSIQLIAAFDGGNNWIDSNNNDNADTLKQRVVAAVDPNDKTSYPEGNITKETKELRYQIRFQNTGTDTAYRVTVIDTVDSNLPLTKVMMNSASHKYKLDIKNNVFKWTFDEIMLPDSNRNEALSHGFINYTAQIKPGLAIGTEIKNTAYIYFDYQKPVITNTARSKMVEESVSIREQKTQSISSDLHIYPNPASTYLNIKNDAKTAKETQLVNILGQVVKTIKIQPLELLNLPVNDLKSGMYFIRTTGGNTQKLIIE
ncbi:MAG: T9SS type A sorting domain-containing protein [Sphingobacteriales bacterium]|nr:MAG: T9SS type A sorting domain-containing protein [Sphingobacteriales bacterium]